MPERHHRMGSLSLLMQGIQRGRLQAMIAVEGIRFAYGFPAPQVSAQIFAIPLGLDNIPLNFADFFR